MKKRALIVGAAGQDGRLLTNHLQGLGYETLGVVRPDNGNSMESDRIPIDLNNASEVEKVLFEFRPDEIYYLAAFHHSAEGLSIDDAQLLEKSYSVHVNGLSNVLTGMRGVARAARLFYAASSHIFGDPVDEPQSEETPLNPRCIYGITKTAGVHICRYYRNRHDLFASCGFLFNHESEYRKPNFVSRKIVEAVIRISRKEQDHLTVGNLNAEVDWGYAADYVEAFQKILGLEQPDDFVVATGIKHTVRDFVEIAFRNVGLNWSNYVREDKKIISKPNRSLVGNPSKLVAMTGWQPSVNFEEMIKLLIQATEEELNV